MRTILFCSLALVFSLSANAQSRWGETFSKDNNDAVGTSATSTNSTDNQFTATLVSSHSADKAYSYGMLGVDGDLAKTERGVYETLYESKKDVFKVRASGTLPPRSADASNPYTLAGMPAIDPTDIYGSIVIHFTYSVEIN